MPNFLIDEDTDLLAAEFVLGTLDAEERANAQSLLRIDHAFIAMVRIWERRLSELHLMVEPVDPDAKILERIKAKLAQTPQNEPPTNTRPAAGPLPPSPQLSPQLGSQPAFSAATPEAVPEPVAPESALDAATVAAAGLAGAEATSPEAINPEATIPAESAGGPEAPTLPDAPPLAVPEAQLIPELRLPEAVTRSERLPADKVPPPIPVRIPEIPEAPPDLRPPKPRDATKGIIHSRARWRAFSVVLLLMVAALAGLVAAWKFAPDRVPVRLRPSQLMTSLGLIPSLGQAQAQRPAPPDSQFDE